LIRDAEVAINTMRYAIDPQSDNVQPISVVYFPNTHALRVEYKNVDSAGTPYVSHAVLFDGEDRISYEVQMQDELFAGCRDVYARNQVDLTPTSQ
jgi:hypothetical protein